MASLAEIDQFAALQALRPGRILPVFQYRFGAGLQKAKRIIDLGLAGKAYVASIETAWQRGPDQDQLPWRGHWNTELCGVLTTHAIHSHDLLSYLMGDIGSVFARVTTRVNPVEVEDCASASLLMKSGALASLCATLGSAREISRLRFCFEHVMFESALAPYAPGDDPWQIIPSSAASAARMAQALDGWTFGPLGFAGLLSSYHAALESGGPLPVTLSDARRSLELLTALYHSAETGLDVSLPIGAEHPNYFGWRKPAVNQIHFHINPTACCFASP